jgi:hypothetical protein
MTTLHITSLNISKWYQKCNKGPHILGTLMCDHKQLLKNLTHYYKSGVQFTSLNHYGTLKINRWKCQIVNLKTHVQIPLFSIRTNHLLVSILTIFGSVIFRSKKDFVRIFQFLLWFSKWEKKLCYKVPQLCRSSLWP